VTSGRERKGQEKKWLVASEKGMRDQGALAKWIVAWKKE
jgi:hypothetical protein